MEDDEWPWLTRCEQAPLQSSTDLGAEEAIVLHLHLHSLSNWNQLCRLRIGPRSANLT